MAECPVKLCLASHTAGCSSEMTGAARAHKADVSMAEAQGGGIESASNPIVLSGGSKLQKRTVQTHIQPVAHLVSFIRQ